LWSSIAVWALACLVSIFVFGIIHGVKSIKLPPVVAQRTCVPLDAKIVGVLQVTMKKHSVGVLIAAPQTFSPYIPENKCELFSSGNRHLPFFSRLQGKGVASFLKMHDRYSSGIAVEHKAVASDLRYSSSGISNIKDYVPGVRIWNACGRDMCSHVNPYTADDDPGAKSGYESPISGISSPRSMVRLLSYSKQSEKQTPNLYPIWPTKDSIPTWRVPFGLAYIGFGLLVCMRVKGFAGWLLGLGCGVLGVLFVLNGYIDRQSDNQGDRSQVFQHNTKNVSQKLLTPDYLRITLNTARQDMANLLGTDKKIAVIAALTEGSSIRSIERMAGVHRDTIMRPGVKVGQGCAALLDQTMRNLPCSRLEMDEIWGFVGKKDRNVRVDDDLSVGSVWTFCAIDADTKLVPAFKVGERNAATANAFVADVASRMKNRVQISTDGLKAYVDAVEKAFGADVDYAQIVKTYGHEEASDNRRYSAPEFVSSEVRVIAGNPDQDLISTSYVERLNATTRLHMRRLTRLTLAFSKKRGNFEAAVGLHFAYYNFVKRHNTLRCTPAMAAGVARSFWTVGDLVEAAA
jgi:IS1 family transposase